LIIFLQIQEFQAGQQGDWLLLISKAASNEKLALRYPAGS